MIFSSIFAVYPPTPFHSPSRLKNIDRLTQYLAQKREISAQGCNFISANPLICEVRPMGQKERLKHFSEKAFLRPGSPLICFEGHFPKPADFRPAENEDQYTDADYEQFWPDLLSSHLDMTMHTYILCLNIAFSGAANTVSNIRYINNRLYGGKSYFLNYLGDANDLMETLGWRDPKVCPDKTIAWVWRQNGVFNGNSNTAASRALSYFTRLFTREYRSDEMSNLVWAMAGIEALLVRGGSSSTFQIKEKLGAITRSLNISSLDGAFCLLQTHLIDLP